MPFARLEDLVAAADARDIKIWELMLLTEQEQEGMDPAVIMDRMAAQFTVMEAAVRKGLRASLPSRGGLIGDEAYKLQERWKDEPGRLLGPVAGTAMAYAMAVSEVNAAMGCIVATPTAGAAGVLPGVLVALLDAKRCVREEVIHSLFTAAAIGLVIANSASISGAAGGCQAEIGSAAAMTAGAVVELYGGAPRQVADAVGLALTNSLGLVCDPIAGLVEAPCLYRNGLHAVTALAVAECTLAGIRAVIPPDEVVSAMREIGNQLPASLRETGIGGLAGTPTGRLLRQKILGGDNGAGSSDTTSEVC